jgi:GntR family transcriptional regulator, transcriptional repressor for pyruvate dehydrogenase complex
MASSPRFTEIGRRSAAGDVVESIKAMISQGDLEPGQRLPSQRELSVRLGISVPTVREAINSLREVGLVEARHGSGTYVTALDPQQLMEPVRFALSLSGRGLAELFDVRLLLEPAAAHVAAMRRTDEELAEIQRCAKATARRGLPQRRLLELDAELHDRIFRASHNHLLIALMGSIAALAIKSRQRTVSLSGVPRQTHDDHERIVEAIAAGDGPRAESAMRDHIRNVRAAAVAAGMPADDPLLRVAEPRTRGRTRRASAS